MYPGREEAIRAGQEALERMPRARPTQEELAERRLQQMTHDLEELRKDPSYAETHVTSFPEINAQVGLANVLRARAIADRDEREEADRQYQVLIHERAEDVRRRLREQEDEAVVNVRENTLSWSDRDLLRPFRMLYQ
jgi:hypothetical protein